MISRRHCMRGCGPSGSNPVRHQDPAGLKIQCSNTFREQFFGKCPPGAGACTSINLTIEYFGPCRQTGKCGEWGFDVRLRLHHRIQYVTRKSDRGRDGLPYGEHELNHIGDMDRWCATLESSYPTEGFKDITECTSARTRLFIDLFDRFKQAKSDSDRRRDK